MNKQRAEQIVAQTLQQYDRISENFDSTRNTSTDFTLLSSYVKPENLVLDVGCGNGRIIDVLRDSGANLICTDGSGELVRIAQERYAADVEKGWLGFVHRDAFNLPFDSHQFDVVFMMAVMHHIPSSELRQHLMREIHGMTKKGGTFVGTTWNLRSREFAERYKLAEQLAQPRPGYDAGDVEIPWKAYGAEEMRYCHAYTLDELRALFTDTGWRVEKLYPAERTLEEVEPENAPQLFWELTAV